MTIVIGLTGGIGSGKSTVARYMAGLGAAHIDADKVGHEAFRPGTPAYEDVVKAFGARILAPSGDVDRKKLGQIVFEDTKAREELNRIMWSRIWEMIAARIDDLRSSGVGVVVVEAFGLIEAGWDRLVDRVWVTVASEKAVLDRLEKQRDLPEADVLARIRSQMSNEERAKYADVVIRNEGTPEELKAIVGQMWDSHLRDFSAGKAGPRQGKESERTIDK